MSPAALPSSPNLEHLKKQAKELRKAHQSGDLEVCERLQNHLPRFARQTHQQILAGSISLHDAQHVVARSYGFESWSALREAVAKRAGQSPRVSALGSPDKKMQGHIEKLGFESVGAYRIWCRKLGLDSGLDKDEAQLRRERELRSEAPPEPIQGHRQGQAEKITRIYRRQDTTGWCVHLFDATEDEAEREALYRLLIHVERYTRINWDAAAQLARHHRDWLNPVESWFPESDGSDRQLGELTRYLLGSGSVPLFENARLLQEDGPSAGRQRTQARHRGSPVLSKEEIASFEKQGYIRVPGAFPREAALKMQDFMWSELERLHGFERSNPSTWQMPGWEPTKWTRLKLNQTSDHPVYEPIASPRLLGAYADLAGQGKAASKQSWGPFRVHFPERTDASWDIGHSWDMWDTPRSDLNTVLGVYTFYSDVGHQGGGPLVVEGSHLLVMSFFDRMTPDDLKQSRDVRRNRFFRSHPYFAELSGKVIDQGDRIRRFMEETTVVDDVPARVVELTGEPGDAIIYHPALLRGESPNLSDAPRFIRG